MQWCDKYKPIKIDDIIGQTTAIKQITEFLMNNDLRIKKKKNCILLTGKNGIGKTLLANVVTKQLGFDVKHVDDDNDLKKIMNVSSFFNKTKEVVIIYECCYIKSVAEDNKIINKSKQPIIFICDSEEIEQYKALKKNCEILYMKPPTQKQLVVFLTDILKQEKLKISKKIIEELCEQSEGDVRWLLLNSQFWGEELKLKSGFKDVHNFNMFKMVPYFFDHTITTNEKIEEYFIDTHYLPQLLFFNYLKTKVAKIDTIYDKLKKDIQVQKPNIKEEDITMFYKLNVFSKTIDVMSDADIMDKQIQITQNYSTLPHFKHLMASACTNCSGMLLEKDISYKDSGSKNSKMLTIEEIIIEARKSSDPR